jgi:multiple sugar transport system permease protein
MDVLKKQIKLEETGGMDAAKFGFIMILPALVMLLFIVIFPLLSSIYLSLSVWSPMTGGGTRWYEAYQFWGWLSNYWNILRDADFLRSILRTFVIVAVVVPVEFFIGLGLAFLFRDNFPGKKIFHSIILMPMMIVPAVAGFVFYMLFQGEGPINMVLSGLAFKEVSILWLQGKVSAIIAIMIADIWQWSPFMFLILLSGLMALPEDQISAAVILGASKWQRFRMVLFPLMKPVIVIALIFRGMEAVKIFDAIWLMTTGGPGTATESISVYMYKHGFKHLRWSWVAAGGVLILILMTIISMQALKPIKEQEEEAS